MRLASAAFALALVFADPGRVLAADAAAAPSPSPAPASAPSVAAPPVPAPPMPPSTVPLGTIDTVRFPYVLVVAGELNPKRTLLPAFTLAAMGGAFATAAGPYTIAGTDANGATLFVQTFEANVAVQYSSQTGFDLAIPLTASALAGLAKITVSGRGKSVSEIRLATEPPVVRATRAGRSAVSIVWDGDRYPEARVETPDGGFVISGHTAASTATIRSEAASLTIDFSNGVTSTAVTVPVN